MSKRAKNPNTPQELEAAKKAVDKAAKRTGAEKRKQDAATIADLKDKYVEYYEDLPVQKYACMFIGRTPEAVQKWQTDDPDFLARVELAKANWAKKRAARTSAQFQLERLDKDIWAERKELTGKEGSPLRLDIFGDTNGNDDTADDGTTEDTPTKAVQSEADNATERPADPTV